MYNNKVVICGVDTSKLPLLKEKQKVELITRAQNGDNLAREELINGNLRLVLSVIQRFTSRGENPDDLFQVGCIGLIKAIDNFDTSHLVKFSTYAVPMISGEIKRFLRDDGMIKVSRSLKELSYKAYLCQERMQEKFGRDPTIQEIAEEMHVDCEELTMALEAGGEIDSIYKSVYQKDGQEIQLVDKLAQQNQEEEKVLNHMLLRQLLNNLNKEERRLIYLRYFADKTQTEVGEELGISQVQVSRLEKKILKNLREQL